ncbi:lantibiotic dehydratase [Corynebacterium freiburgense]|uniref:lantibiotic dehydratase n=1 Tax=Corynebacterium freiburgense TaxID=556548 RepID=UPI00041F6B83|nr:lantibiotic dehydratase [Corynebacterium freiburgense]WJZ01866.1 hypothetical protein CFREI_02810 [Corynebacterium freiburgense]
MKSQLVSKATGIRSASVRWEEYLEFLHAEGNYEKLRLAYSNPTIRTTLKAFHPIIDRNIQAIFQGELLISSKKGRKTLRHVITLMARSATRATPSRLLGRVGNIHEASKLSEGIGRNIHIVLHNEMEIGCVEPIVPHREEFDTPIEVRWNPCVIDVGARYYVTAPRHSEDPFGSVGKNKLLNRIADLTKQAMPWGQLVQTLMVEFQAPSPEPVEKALTSLLHKEFLLSSSSLGYAARCKKQLVSTKTSTSCINELTSQWVIENQTSDFEVRRDATVHIDEYALTNLERCYSLLIEYGLVDTADQGVAQKFAELIHERYGFSRICLTDLIHPAFGFSYQGVIDAFTATRDTSPDEKKVELCGWAAAHKQQWIDLNQKEIRDLLRIHNATTKGRYSTELTSFAVPVVPQLSGTPDNKPLLIACDGTVALPGPTLTTRYRLLSDAPPSAAQAVPGAVNAGIDWMGPKANVNAIRESSHSLDYNVNVNGFSTNNKELLCKDLYLWSDGDRIYCETQDGTRLRFEPSCMASIQLYPDWVRLLYLATTVDWPIMAWSWKALEQYHDVLPGVRYDNVILERPKYRFRGNEIAADFNQWCDGLSISEWVRLGSHDRKVLVNRRLIQDSAALIYLLRSGGNWVEDASVEQGSPLSVDHEGKRIHSELVVTFQCPQNAQEQTYASRPKFADVFNFGCEQIIPATSTWVNIELVPRGNAVAPLIPLLQKLPKPYYFVRYRTQSGKPCLRLRMTRDDLMQIETRASIETLVWDGWVAEVKEQQHRLEIERYGGEKAFAAFTELFIVESAFVSSIANQQLLEPLSLEERSFFLFQWLKLSPIDIKKAVVQRGFRKGSSVKRQLRIPDSYSESLAKNGAEIDEFFAEVQRQMEIISQHVGESLEPWAVAAHLFCNRLGISSDEEKLVWKAIGQKTSTLERV